MTQPPPIVPGAPQTATTISAPTADPATPARRRRWLPLLVGLVVLALAGAAAFILWPRDVTISGTVQLTASGGIAKSGGTCNGTRGFSDLRKGTQVVVTDPHGTVIGVTVLGNGRVVTSDSCIWTFSLTVPGQDIYGIKVAERNVLQFTRADVEKPLKLSIGS